MENSFKNTPHGGLGQNNSLVNVWLQFIAITSFALDILL